MVLSEAQTQVDSKLESLRQQLAIKKTESSTLEKISLFDQLLEFNFGRSLLENQSLTQYWRHFLLTYPFQEEKILEPSLFNELLHHFPIFIAMQQRYKISLELLQRYVQNNAALLSLPCGLMEDFAYLDYKHIDNIKLVALDSSLQTLEQAKGICQTRGIDKWLSLKHQDPWTLDEQNTYDAISSHGLTIYESSKDKILYFYQKVFNALKPNGAFILAFLSSGPSQDTECEWDFSKINAAYLRKQNVLFLDVINFKKLYYRKTVEIRKMLSQVGFEDIRFVYDEAKIFPSVLALKKSKKTG